MVKIGVEPVLDVVIEPARSENGELRSERRNAGKINRSQMLKEYSWPPYKCIFLAVFLCAAGVFSIYQVILINLCRACGKIWVTCNFSDGQVSSGLTRAPQIRTSALLSLLQRQLSVTSS